MPEKLREMLKTGKLTAVLASVCILAVLLVLFLPKEKKESSGEPVSENTSEEALALDYAATLSEEIRRTVTAITGEKDPHVTVTLESMGETVYASENRESAASAEEYDGEHLGRVQSDGDTERSYTVIRDADGGERPLIIMRSAPQIRGVVIVSSRGNEPVAREKITEAVKTMLHLSSTQVYVSGQA